MDVMKAGAALTCGVESTFRDVHAEQSIASGGKLFGENADGAANFESVAVVRAGKAVESVPILASFIFAGREAPWVLRGGVDAVEVAWWQAAVVAAFCPKTAVCATRAEM